MMTPLPTLLRDSCLAALAFSVVGQVCGQGASVAAGSVAGVINLAGLAITASGNPGALMGRLALHNVTALVLLYVLLTRFEPVPALLGLLAPLFAIAARTFLRPAQPAPAPGADR